MASNKKRLLVSSFLGAGGWNVLKGREDVEAMAFPGAISTSDLNAFLRAGDDVNGIIVGLTRLGDPEFAAANGLQVVARIGVGYDTVDVAALTRHRLPLMVVGEANSPSVAEQALFMMLTLAKRGAQLQRHGERGPVEAERLTAVPVDLYGKTVVVVGFGRIGTRIAKRCLAMEMKVCIYDPYVSADRVSGGRLRAGRRSRCGTAARRFCQHPLPQDAGDGRHVQCRKAGAHETHRLSGQHRARRHRRGGGAACGAHGRHHRRGRT